ncbi:MAG: tetratricopeptide repeat protein [Deltaproteobacteria bacterium]|nr:tetratricopeptide repeat protein [Deltaproteobacteria bacterium]
MKLKLAFRLLIAIPLFGIQVACSHTQGSIHKAKGRPPPQRALPWAGEKEVTPAAPDAILNFLDAQLFAFRGANSQAENALQRAVEADPESAYLHYEYARTLTETHQLPQALVQAKAATHREPSNSRYHVLVGQVYSLQENHAAALQEYRTAIRLNATYEDAHKMLVREYLLMKNYPTALVATQQWIRQNPKAKLAYYSLGSIYSVQLKNDAQAIIAFKKVLDFDPDDIRALASLARIYIDAKKFKEAEGYMSRLEKLAIGDLDITLRAGILYFQLQNYPEAEKRFAKVLRFNPNSDQLLYYLGLTYEVQKKMDEAVNAYAKLPPDSTLFHEVSIRKWVLLFDQEKYKLIESELKALLKKKADPDYYDILAAVLSKQNRYSEGIAVLEKALVTFAGSEKLLFSLGVAYDKVGKVEASVTTMQKLLEVNPKSPMALNYVGYAWADQGIKLQEALELIQKAIKLDPADGYITDSLGWVYFRLGDLEKALFYLKKADLMAPNEYTLLDHLGEVYRKLNQETKAQEYFRRALKLLEEKKTLDRREKEDLEKIRKKITP